MTKSRSSSGRKLDPRVCISMLDPADRGGVYTMVSELHGVLERWGWQPSLLYLSASAEDRLSPRWLLRRGRLWDTRLKINRGMRGMAVGHVLAHFYALASFWPYPAVRRYLNSFDMHVVLGTANCGITLALTRKRYICWLATSLQDEFQARATLGDEWAQKILSSVELPFILWQERLTLSRAALVLALSDYTANQLCEICPDIENRIRVIPCPIDTDIFRSVPGTRDQTDHQPLLLFVGRVNDRRKNVPMLLRAFQQVLRQRPDAQLTLVGGSSPDLLALADRLGLNGSVEFVSPVERGPRLAAYYQRAHVFVLPSRQEGLGIVVQEAMAAGLPVISTRCGGPEGIVHDGDTGYLVANDDPAALARAILRLFEDPGRRRIMGQKARAVAERDFSRQVVAEKFSRAFREVYPDLSDPQGLE